MAHYWERGDDDNHNLYSISMDYCKILKKFNMGDFFLRHSVILTSNKHTLLNATETKCQLNTLERMPFCTTLQSTAFPDFVSAAKTTTFMSCDSFN
jgi:hypothetical protein